MKVFGLFFCTITICLFIGCASDGAKGAGQTVGSVIRAPVDFVAGIGRGISGPRLRPQREFKQDWDQPDLEPIFWEEDETFFSSLQN